MRWDRFFEDLEDQLDSEWEAERAALDAEAERLRLARLTLRERLGALASAAPTAAVSVEVADGSVFAGRLAAVGADWCALQADVRRAATFVLPLATIAGFAVSHAELLRSARPAASASRLSDRMTLGFVLRDLSRRRVPVGVGVIGGTSLAGTIDRAGSDHVDIALHDVGVPRRAEEVRGFRMVPLAAVCWVRVDADAPIG